MKRKILFAMIIAAALLPPAAAQESETANGRPPAGENKAAEKLLTVRLKSAPIGTLLDIISGKTGYTFSFSDPGLAKKRITIFFRNATADELLEFLTKAKDLEFQRLGNSDNFVVLESTVPFAGFPPLTRQDIEDPLLNRVISLRVKGVFLPDFLNIVSEQARVNFVVDAEYVPVSANLSKITVVDVLQFLKTKGLSYSRIGKTSTFVIRTLRESGNRFKEAEEVFNEGKYEVTIAAYKEFLDVNPDSEMADYALLRMAVSYDWIAARDNDPSALKEEEKLLNRLVADYPKSARLGDAYLYLGQIYSGYGGIKSGAVNCEKALEFYELAVQKSYRDWVKAQAKGRMAQCYERDGDKEKAAGLYAEIIEKYPETDTAKELRELAKGRHATPGTLAGIKQKSDAMLEAGAALEEQSEYKLAMEVYKRQVEKGVPAESARKAELRLGVCQAAMNETGAAIKTFEAYVAKYKPGPEDEAYTHLAQALEKAGRGEEARKYRGQKK